MQFILNIPFDLRLGGLFFIGTALGALLNWAIYGLAFDRRQISPWMAPPAGAPPRRWSDRIPVIGWFGLRRESRQHGRGFWLRPCFIELACGIGLAVLYCWETDIGGLLPPAAQLVLHGHGPAGRPQRLALLVALHWNFLAHACLLSLLLVASLIDIDERLIPDEITLPGTLLGLLLAAVAPRSLLPIMQAKTPFLDLCAPNAWPWPGDLKGSPDIRSLAIGLGCLWFWCLLLLPRSWRGRHGLRRALAIFCARLAREPFTRWVLAIGLAASAASAVVWRGGGEHWQALLSALVGMAAGAGMIWSVRIAGQLALRREAMGFGDVTLMAMIGAFLGWQPCLVVFFLAPLAGLVVGGTQWLLTRHPELRYGPFLSLAALTTIVCWADLWEWLWRYFAIGWLMPAAICGCLLLLAPLLLLVRMLLAIIAWLIGAILRQK